MTGNGFVTMASARRNPSESRPGTFKDGRGAEFDLVLDFSSHIPLLATVFKIEELTRDRMDLYGSRQTHG
jgi:hypothetical protein